MGADLVLTCIEIPKNLAPVWQSARDRLNDMSEEECVQVLMDYHQCDKEDVECSIDAKNTIAAVLNSIEEQWENDTKRDMCVITLFKTKILISGGMSYGDCEEGVDLIGIFAESGLAHAAGFLIEDRREQP